MHRSYFILLLIGLFLGSCGGPQSLENQRIKSLLRKMTLRQKIGQMFIVGVEGQEIDQNFKRAIAKDYLGGFYLAAGKNFIQATSAARLIHQFQKVALASTEIPLFICARQEGGLLQTLNQTNGATDTPGNFALGINGGFEDAYSVYRIMARELRATGFNLAFAPVVNLPPKNLPVTSRLRLFSGNPDLVAKLAQAAVRGFQQNGIIAAAGFFPDFPEPDTTRTLPTGILESRPGFQAVISEDVSAIIIPTPALFADKRLLYRLNNDFGFNNLLISDDLNRFAGATPQEAAALSIQAGIDLIFQQTSDLDLVRQQMDAVVRAVESGQISRKRIDESVTKILRLKTDYRLFETSIVDLMAIEKRVGTPEALQESLEISRRCVTILKDSLNLVPLKKSDYQSALLITPDSSQTVDFQNESCFPGKNLLDLLQKEIPEIKNLETGATVTDSLRDLALKMAESVDLVVFLTLDTPADSLEKILNTAKFRNKPMIHLSVVPPAKFIPHLSTWVILGGVRRISLQAAVDVLFGRAY